MTREEVYCRCFERFYASTDDYEKGIVTGRQILPQEAIDAIIDCAVEEAIKAVKELHENQDNV